MKVLMEHILFINRGSTARATIEESFKLLGCMTLQ
jgi:hypothetical protein